MKKGEIKRRKRVMPAMSNQVQQHTGSSIDSSVSPDPQQVGTQDTSYQEGQEIDLPHHGHSGSLLEPPTQSYGPPPVDFTAYSTSMAPAGPTSSASAAYSPAIAGSRSSRKRTLSAAELQPAAPGQALRSHGNQSPIASRGQAEASSRSSDAHDSAIDPSLSSPRMKAASSAMSTTVGDPLHSTQSTASGAPGTMSMPSTGGVPLPSPSTINGGHTAHKTKAEKKARLKAELDRLQRIVDEIDSENSDD
jgi:hypothetical protein